MTEFAAFVRSLERAALWAAVLVAIACLLCACGPSRWTIHTDGTWSEAEIEAASVFVLASFAELDPVLAEAEDWITRDVEITYESWQDVERDCGALAWGCWYEVGRMYIATSTPTWPVVPTMAQTALTHEWMHAALQNEGRAAHRQSREHACPWFGGKACRGTDLVTTVNADMPDMPAHSEAGP
jgi:hypothetical protein